MIQQITKLGRIGSIALPLAPWVKAQDDLTHAITKRGTERDRFATCKLPQTDAPAGVGLSATVINAGQACAALAAQRVGRDHRDDLRSIHGLREETLGELVEELCCVLHGMRAMAQSLRHIADKPLRDASVAEQCSKLDTRLW